MKKVSLATLVLALGSGTAFAAPLALNGSDTLFDFTNELMKPSRCNVDPALLTYAGGGSTLGANNMTAGTQQIAPMSSLLSGANVTAGVSQGCKVALDALSILVDDNEANDCDTMVYSATMPVQNLNGVAGVDNGKGVDCVATPAACDVASDGSGGVQYTFSDWRDVLRIVYGGQTEHRTLPSACSESPISRSAIAAQACNSDVRHTLVKNWSNLFQEGAGCNGADADNCTALRHAFRRDDASGTTDVFLETIGLPKISATDNPFCNGKEMQDEDPIRVNCSETNLDGDEQVCNAVPASLLGPSNVAHPSTQVGWHGGATTNPADSNSADLGLVLSMVIPQVSPYTDTLFCSTGPLGGSFRYAPMPSGAVTAAMRRCPDGSGDLGGFCAWPARKVGASYFLGCVNRKRNIPTALATAVPNMDGRAYNLIPRNPDGSIQTVERIVSGAAAQVQLHHAMYRIHETAVMPGGVATTGGGCQFVDATDQIGCLVHASPCSLGFAGVGADLRDPNKPLALATPQRDSALCAVDGLDNDNDGSIDESGEICGAVLATAADPDSIRRLNDPSGAACGTATAYAMGDHFDTRYPLSRNLWLNSKKGFRTTTSPDDSYTFSNITNANAEQQLSKCACDRFYSDAVAAAVGFVPLGNPADCTAPLQHGVCDAQLKNY